MFGIELPPFPLLTWDLTNLQQRNTLDRIISWYILLLSQIDCGCG